MAGYFAGISKAPFTAILLITEMVGTLQHLMPLAVVSLIAYLTVDVLGGTPVYAAMLEQSLQKAHHGQSQPVTQLEFPVFENAIIDGQQTRDVNWPEGTLLTEIKRGERVIVPHGDTVIRLGDTLLLNVPQKKTVTRSAKNETANRRIASFEVANNRNLSHRVVIFRFL